MPAAAVAFASAGYGNLSFDHLLGIDKTLRHPVITALGLTAGIAGALTVLAQRDFSPPPGTSATPTMTGARNGETSGANPAPAAG